MKIEAVILGNHGKRTHCYIVDFVKNGHLHSGIVVNSHSGEIRVVPLGSLAVLDEEYKEKRT